MAVTKVFKIIDPRSVEVDVTNNVDYSGSGSLYGNHTWYNRLVSGSSQRAVRYREFDTMDTDIDVARALDIIAEEIAGNNPKTETPLIIKLELDGGVKVQSRVVSTLNAALKTWCNIHDWRNRIFKISRNTIKYGDCFFMRPKKKNGRFVYRHPKNVIGAIVSEHDINDIRGWHIRNDPFAVEQSPTSGQLYYNVNGQVGDASVEPYSADDVIRFTLHDEMSDEAPFGKSILGDVFRAFKQKQLLEDAILIYRIQRAPERRVFYIDVAHLHPAKVAQHLEQIRNEMKQKKVPTMSGGKSGVESVYDPQSMNEDYYFAQYKDGNGSRVETLPGGQGLGELRDLDYFYKRIWRGLRIPQSYIDPNSDGGTFNDGKVGIAYLQEIKFALYIERLQAHIESSFDAEFKRFLRESNILIDESIFKIVLPTPSNYDVSRKQQMDAELLSNFSTAEGISKLSARFALKKYLQLTDEEMIMNERMLREEKGLDPDGDYRDLPKLYSPEDAEGGGFEGGLGSFSGGAGGPTAPALDDFENEDDGGDIGDDAATGDDADADPTNTKPNAKPDAKPDAKPAAPDNLKK